MFSDAEQPWRSTEVAEAEIRVVKIDQVWVEVEGWGG